MVGATGEALQGDTFLVLARLRTVRRAKTMSTSACGTTTSGEGPAVGVTGEVPPRGAFLVLAKLLTARQARLARSLIARVVNNS